MSFNPLTAIREPAVIADPYPYYAKLREEAPLLRDSFGRRIISRYAEVYTLLNHPAAACDRMRSVCQMRSDADDPEIVELFETLRRFFVFLDPPHHTRLRGLVSKAFTPRSIQGMHERIQRLVDTLLDRAFEKDAIDVMSDLAVPLPVAVITDMLGLPASDGPALKHWSSDVAEILGGTMSLPHEDAIRIARSLREYMEYFRVHAEERRRRPGNDLLTALVRAEIDGDALDAIDTCATAVLLIFAGHETTTHLIGNGVLALVRDAEARELLHREPELWPAAIEEFLRFDSPVQLVGRSLDCELEIAGERLAPNELVYLLLGAANRDPAAFERPDHLDFRRARNRHLAFGQGPHYCIGASLARLEAQLAIRGLLARIPEPQLRGEKPVRSQNPAFRGLLRLSLATR